MTASTEGPGNPRETVHADMFMQMWIEQSWGTAIEFASITHGDD
jgi:hypothetical protein